MEKKISTGDYFKLQETNRPMELVYGYVREPPSPFYSHQVVVGRMFRLLAAHVEQSHLGVVCVAPLDVILDQETDLIVQPDLLFVAQARLEIVKDQVWGAPDLVVEVESPTSEHRDRTLKLTWYRRYGVKEYWQVDPRDRRIDIVDCVSNTRTALAAHDRVQSKILPAFAATVEEFFNQARFPVP